MRKVKILISLSICLSSIFLFSFTGVCKGPSEQLFLKAAYDGDKKTVLYYIQNKGDINVTGDMTIISTGDITTSQNNLRFSQTNFFYHVTALMLTAYNGKTDVAKILIDANANIGLKDSVGRTTLMIASEEGRTDIVKLLIDAKANVNTRDDVNSTALLLASGKGHVDIVKLLIDAKAEINVSNFMNYTALMAASEGGYTSIVKLLIDEKADVNEVTKYNKYPYQSNYLSALMLASQKGYIDIAKILIDAKADVNTKDDKNKTALSYAILGHHTNIVRVLVDAKADINGQSGVINETYLELAKTLLYDDIVNILKDAGAKEN